MPLTNIFDTKEDYFTHLSKNWEDRYYNSKFFRERLKEFEKLIKKYGEGKETALDYGCGTGTIAGILENYINCVTASDLSHEMLRITREKFKDDKKVNVLELEDIKLSKFDLIVCSSVIEYAENDRELLEMLYDKLNPNGILIITFPKKSGPLQVLNKYLFKYFDRYNYTNFQLHTYTAGNIKKLISGFDLEVKELYIQSIHFNIGLLGEMYFCVAEKVGSRE